ncbi:MAG: hypothetical protein HFG57_10650 [Lachnospiraceae bacterium]|nr:hypothetical protein [Lachnospiraceae bacterium]
MSEIFDETNMRRILGKHIPEGETLLAGIHGISQEVQIRGIFGKCIRTEDKLIPDEKGGVIALDKRAYSTHDVYIGITQHSLVIAGCERNQYLYQFGDVPDGIGMDVQEITSELFLADIGTRFSLADIQSCKYKKGWMGSVKCFLTMKNGSYFKLIFPKLGGLGKGMPHHAEYREAIIQRLSEN